MEHSVVVLPAKLEETFEVHAAITEFESDYLRKRLQRLDGKEKLVLLANCEGKKVGYLIGYGEDDGKTFYIWLAGVKSEFRRHGVLTALFNDAKEWARKKHYSRLRWKTKNRFRELLFFLVKNGFEFTQVIPVADVSNNELVAERQI